MDEEAFDIMSQQWNKMAINGKHIDISGTKNTFNLTKALETLKDDELLAVYASVWTNEISNHVTLLKHWYGDKILTV